MQRAFSDAFINNRRWSSLKRAIYFKSIRFSQQLSLDKLRIEGKLVKDLEEAMDSGNASQVLVAWSVLYRHLEAKHEGCRVRTKLHAIGQEDINVARWVSHVKAQRDEKTTIVFLTNLVTRSKDGNR